MGKFELFVQDLQDEGLDVEAIDMATSNIEVGVETDIGISDMSVGQKGADGVGIASIDVNESDVSGGANEVIITLTNNTSKTFVIHNGEDYVITDKDKQDISKTVIGIVSEDFARKNDVATVRIVDAKHPTETEKGVDGYARALDVKDYVGDYTKDMLRYEET